MIFRETRLSGAYLIDLELHQDDRGFFARTWCRREFEDHGLNSPVVQTNVSLTRRKGSLRGMHYQAEPYGEAKLLRCTRGAIHDVIIDLRRDSPTRGEWIAEELTENNHRMLYVPEGFAHGFQTLTDDAEVTYHMMEFHTPSAARGVRYDDPAFGIEWPLPVTEITARDRVWPDWVRSEPTVDAG
jgi:dTDP-4-dehydrorhamnose 3,5-epimerase